MGQEFPYHQSFSSMERKKRRRNLISSYSALQVGHRKMKMIPTYRFFFYDVVYKMPKRNLAYHCHISWVVHKNQKMNLKHPGSDFFCQDYRTTRTNPKRWHVFLHQSHFQDKMMRRILMHHRYVSLHSIAFQGVSKMKKMYLMVRSFCQHLPNPMVTMLPEKYTANS